MTEVAAYGSSPAECHIEINGTPLPSEMVRALNEVEVTMSRSQATTGALRFLSFRDETGDWSVQDSGLFAPWNTVRIVASFGDDTKEVMRGYIRQINLDYPADMGAATVSVLVQDETLALDRQHLRRVWTPSDSQNGTVSDGQIVRELVKDSFDRVVADPGLNHQSLCQDATPASFLRVRAEALGYELYTRDGVFYFHELTLDDEPQPGILVYAGAQSNCSRLLIQHDGHLPDRVRIDRAVENGHDSDSRTFQSRLPLLGSQSVESQTAQLPPFEWREARSWGSARAQREAAGQAAANRNAWKVRAEGELDGTRYGHVLLTHRTVEIDGVGSTYGGRYYVDEVTHAFSTSGYTARFRIIRNATDVVEG